MSLREQQLAAFYQKHDPSKVSQVHTLLTKYAYDDVKASLLSKYKTLPDGWGDNATAAPAAGSLREQQLVAFYQIHDASKVPMVKSLLSNYSFADVKASLLTKYKSLPEGWGDTTAAAPAPAPSMSDVPVREQQLAAFYAKNDPSKVSQVHTLLTKYVYDDVKASLLAKYKSLPEGWGNAAAAAPAPAPSMSDVPVREQQLAAFYAKNDPSKVSQVHTLLTKYAYDDVKASLLSKYKTLPDGWETNATAAPAAPPAASKKDPSVRQQQKEALKAERTAQLTQFYHSYDPEKVSNVDALITNYSYDDLKMSLIIKYNALPKGWGVAAPNPAVMAGTAEEQLTAFYQQKAPAKTASASTILAQHKLQDISASLLKAYGELPAGWAATASSLVEGDALKFIVAAAKAVQIPIQINTPTLFKFYVGLDVHNDAHDLGFTVCFKPASGGGMFGGNKKLYEPGRIKLPKWPEGLGGEVQIRESGVLTLEFDNSYSWVTPKVVVYKTQMGALSSGPSV